MANGNTPPRRDTDFVPWLANFNTIVQAEAVTLGVPAALATSLNTATTAFMAAWDVVIVPATRTTPAINVKDESRETVEEIARGVIGMIQANPLVSDEKRLELGLPIRDSDSTPTPVPNHAPDITSVAVTGRLLRGRLRDATDANNRGRPLAVAGATIFSYVGESAPLDMDDWKFEGNTNSTHFQVQFPASVPNGAQVWITAYWRNAVSESGPIALPVTANLAGGLPQAA